MKGKLKWKVGAIIGASLYLAIGVTALGGQDKEVAEKEIKSTPTVTATQTEMPTEEPTEIQTEFSAKTTQPVSTREHRSLIWSYDWDEKENEMLAKIAMAEAGNQDIEGKALVILVVLNRVWGDNEFPNSIAEVIYQPRQFSPVLEGKFENVVPDDDCYRAIDLVISGWDESQGALYFESKSDSTWHKENLNFLFKHGDHYFYTEKEK